MQNTHKNEHKIVPTTTDMIMRAVWSSIGPTILSTSNLVNESLSETYSKLINPTYKLVLLVTFNLLLMVYN